MTIKNDLDQQKTLFLLGGMDLEMQTIESLLIDFGFQDITETKDFSVKKVFANKKLAWENALVASYMEFLSFEGVIYGIELRNEETIIEIPQSYKIIDHHNEFVDRHSSIEQVINILRADVYIECQETILIDDEWLPNKDKSLIAKVARAFNLCPIKYLKLIAANDVGHKIAMRNLGIDNEIIDKIRNSDRNVQGITITEWNDAGKFLQDKRNISYRNNICLVKYEASSNFAVVTDRLDESRLIVYNHNSICYYGYNAHKLEEVFPEWYSQKIVFKGGKVENGYFGFTDKAIAQEGVEKIIDKIIEKISNFSSISHHIFLFPFQWDYKSTKVKVLFDESFKDRTNLAEVKKLFENSTQNSKTDDQSLQIEWKPFKFKIKNDKDYNEYTYFYNHVREAIFDNLDNPDEGVTYRNKTDNPLLLQYYCFDWRQDNRNFKYIINIKNICENKKYTLNIENITLNFFDSGVGVMAFHLSNYYYRNPDDILIINDFGRRIYPQFLGNTQDDISLLGAPKRAFLADSIELKMDSWNKSIIENFNTYDELLQEKEIKPKLPKFIVELLGDKFSEKLRKEDNNMVQIRPIVDDRMFILSWYGSNDTINALKSKTSQINSQDIYNYEKSELWYKYIFVDNSTLGLANINLMSKLIKEHTYDRWINWGTLYGISRYSFVVLTDDGEFARKTVLRHLETMYFQITLLALVQRASVLRFSIEVTSQSVLDDSDSLSENIQELHKKYIRFVNKVYFREVTAQEQGIELYDMLCEKMRIEREVKNLDNEIEELSRFATNTEAHRSNKTLNKINLLVFVFIIPTLILTFFGMNVFDTGMVKGGVEKSAWFYYSVFGFVALILISTPFILFKKTDIKDKKFQVIATILVILITLLILIMPAFNHFCNP